ncbi:MAG: GAF domain-containing protein [Hydrogenothermaceae bacterium]
MINLNEDFYNLVEELFSQESVEDFLHSVSLHIREKLKAERATLLIYDKEDNSLKSIVFQAKIGEKLTIPLDIPSIAGYTFKNRKSLIIDDVNDRKLLDSIDKTLKYHEYWKEVDNITPTKTMLSVPIFFKENPVGVFVAVNKFPSFTKEDLEYVESMVKIIAIAFKNLERQLELHQIHQLNCKIIDSISDGIIVTDSKNNIRYVNEALIQMTGFRYTQDSIVGSNIFETFPFLERKKAYILQAIKNNIIKDFVIGILKVKVIPVLSNYLFEPKIEYIIYILES